MLVDFVPSGGELVDNLHGYGGGIGDSSADLPPLEADPLGELVTELSFAEVPRGLGPVEERAGVESDPTIVGPSDEVGDDNVAVKVGGAAREVR